ncbi:hypothetical protein AAC03nite_04980 [Alicyclobacillus acidoterrestris]|nr:hypothetical protein AAC03nite_04980 [Alicyclobacillus acidoterrestris]
MTNKVQYMEDQRVAEVLELLGCGMTRDEIAARRQITRSALDQYMRRKHYVWKKESNTYEMTPNHPHYVERDRTPAVPTGRKVRQVLQEFSKPGMHAKEVARRVGFLDVREMAQYMGQRGYTWSPDVLNYIRLPRADDNVSEIYHRPSREISPSATTTHPLPESQINAPLTEVTPYVDWSKFLPLLQFLESNRAKLELLIEQAPSENIELPRYAIPGACRPRSIQMADKLKELMEDFSRDRNVRQREILEIALIEFFKRYGYGAEVDVFLAQN